MFELSYRQDTETTKIFAERRRVGEWESGRVEETLFILTILILIYMHGINSNRSLSRSHTFPLCFSLLGGAES